MVENIPLILKGIDSVIKLTKTVTDKVAGKEAKDIAKKLFDSIIDLQSRIIALNSSYQKIVESNNMLRQKLMEVEDWANEKLNYEIFQIKTGTIVYVKKETPQSTNQIYWLCANCFDNKSVKSILQPSKFNYHFCPNCGIEYKTDDTPTVGNISLKR